MPHELPAAARQVRSAAERHTHEVDGAFAWLLADPDCGAQRDVPHPFLHDDAHVARHDRFAELAENFALIVCNIATERLTAIDPVIPFACLIIIIINNINTVGVFNNNNY